MDPPDRVMRAVAPHEPDDLDIRMAREQPDQLATDVAGRPDDAHFDPPRTAPRIHPAPIAR